MNWCHTLITLVLLMVISACAPGPPKLTKAQQTFPTSWLAGTWSTTISDQMIRVTWDAPTGNHMAGAIRYFSLESGELQSESVLVIRQLGGKLTLVKGCVVGCTLPRTNKQIRQCIMSKLPLFRDDHCNTWTSYNTALTRPKSLILMLKMPARKKITQISGDRRFFILADSSSITSV